MNTSRSICISHLTLLRLNRAPNPLHNSCNVVSDIVAVFYYKLATNYIDISMFLNWMQSPPDPCFLCWRGGRVGSREEEAMNSIFIVWSEGGRGEEVLDDINSWGDIDYWLPLITYWGLDEVEEVVEGRGHCECVLTVDFDGAFLSHSQRSTHI